MTQPPAPDQTSGSDEREPRPLMQAIEEFDLEREAERLTSESEWTGGDRNAMTLAKEQDLRVLLVALRPGAVFGNDEAHGRMSLQVIRGSVTVERAAGSVGLTANQLAALDAGGDWSIRAEAESVVLLTIAWPEERAIS